MRLRAVGLLIPLACLVCGEALAQPSGEALERSPEELDAAFTEDDAAREAALWSDVVIDRGRPDPISAMTNAADRIVVATVASQAYTDNEDGLPVTQTTFQVDRVLKGDSTPTRFTIVQDGGIPSDRPDEIVIVSHAFYFSVDQQELLFLSSDAGDSGDQAPSIEHRFRVFEDRVYDENGRGILIEEKVEGPGYRMGVSDSRHPAPRFRQIEIGPHTLTKQFGGDSGIRDFRLGSEQSRSERTSYQNSIGISDFGAVIQNSRRDES